MPTAISVEGVTKRFRLPIDHHNTLQYRLTHPLRTSRYRELLAVNDVSFEVQEGEFVGITGPNGCGKSTLLKMISQIYEPDEGRVTVRGRVSPFLELGVGFKPDLSARENVLLGGAVLGPTRALLASRVDDVLEFAELTEFADMKLKNFSAGMGMRLGFAVAMLADAEILLLDEVLSVGDAHFQEKCSDVFAYYKRQGRTIVLVTHDLGSLELFCDRVILMQSGQVVANGVPAEVTSRYRRLVSSMSEAAPTISFVRKPTEERWGSGEMEITRARVLDRNGRPHHSFLVGDAVVIEVSYTSRTAEGRFNACFVIKRSNGAVLAAPMTKMIPDPMPEVRPGSAGTIRYTIPVVNLLDGSYSVNLWLADEHLQHPYDFIEQALEFRMTDLKGRTGLVDLDGRWSHETSDMSAAAEETPQLTLDAS